MSTTPDEPARAGPNAQLFELTGHRRVVADELTIQMGRGARVLVFSDLRLTSGATDITREVTRTVARAIEECRGPGVVVLAGDAFDLRDGTEVESALLAHPRISSALAGFVGGPDHRLVVLPGTRDHAFAYDPDAIDAIAAIGGEIALAVALEVDTGVGTRLVQVEPGHRLDPVVAFADPRDPNDRPLALHVAREIGPALAADDANGGWLSGIDDLTDSGLAGAFVASRFAYRRLLRRSLWLVVPALVGMALFLSFIEITADHPEGSPLLRIFRLFGSGLALELALVIAVLVFTAT